MALNHRIALVKLARIYDALIITDDVYDFLQWPTNSSTETSTTSLDKALFPRLVDIDRTLEPVPGDDNFGNAMSNGSFSKIAGPGTRTGWAEATRKFVYGLSQCGSSRSGGAPSQLVATMMCELLKSGALQTHIERVLKPAYKRRYEIMMEAIKRELIPLGVWVDEGKLKGAGMENDVFGGYFIWIELPEGIDSEEVASRAKDQENLIVAPGAIFEVQGDKGVTFPGGIRLCFSWEEEGDLEEGVVRLGRIIREVMSSASRNKGKDGNVIASKQDLGEFQ
jgi:DNA-binding transcriptional MocR family regulator